MTSIKFDFSEINAIAKRQAEQIKQMELSAAQEKAQLLRDEEERRKAEAQRTMEANYRALMALITSKLQRRVLPAKVEITIEKHIEQEIFEALLQNEDLMDACKFKFECLGTKWGNSCRYIGELRWDPKDRHCCDHDGKDYGGCL